MSYHIIVDVYTKDAATLHRRLLALKSTLFITPPVVYRHCPECSQMRIESKKTAEELENWAWKTKEVNYIGFVPDDEEEENAKE